MDEVVDEGIETVECEDAGRAVRFFCGAIGVDASVISCAPRAPGSGTCGVGRACVSSGTLGPSRVSSGTRCPLLMLERLCPVVEADASSSASSAVFICFICFVLNIWAMERKFHDTYQQ